MRGLQKNPLSFQKFHFNFVQKLNLTSWENQIFINSIQAKWLLLLVNPYNLYCCLEAIKDFQHHIKNRKPWCPKNFNCGFKSVVLWHSYIPFQWFSDFQKLLLSCLLNFRLNSNNLPIMYFLQLLFTQKFPTTEKATYISFVSVTSFSD